MNTKVIYLLGLTTLLLASALQAQPSHNRGKQAARGADLEAVLARLDTDQSGSLSKDEVRGRMANRFDKIDANSDGAISLDELTAAREQARQRMKEKGEKIRNADSDGNRAISIDEASAAGMNKLVKHFERIDVDSDGEISRREMRAFRQENRKRKGAAK